MVAKIGTWEVDENLNPITSRVTVIGVIFTEHIVIIVWIFLNLEDHISLTLFQLYVSIPM